MKGEDASEGLAWGWGGAWPRGKRGFPSGSPVGDESWGRGQPAKREEQGKSAACGAWRGREGPVRVAEPEGDRESGGRRDKEMDGARPWGRGGGGGGGRNVGPAASCPLRGHHRMMASGPEEARMRDAGMLFQASPRCRRGPGPCPGGTGGGLLRTLGASPAVSPWATGGGSHRLFALPGVCQCRQHRSSRPRGIPRALLAPIATRY